MKTQSATFKINKHEQIMNKTIYHILKVDITDLTKSWHHLKNSRIASRGLKDTIKFLKSLYTLSKRFALEQQIEPLPFCKSDKEGFPSCLAKFKPLLKGTHNERRAALTVLYQYAHLFLPADKNVETIVSPSN